MYCFLNYFAFEKPKHSLTNLEVFNTLDNLYLFCKDLDTNGIKLIINQRLSQYDLNGTSIKEYVQKISEKDKRTFLITKITNYSPFCSDTDTSYEFNELIMTKNCHEEKGNIDVLENFLACAIHNNSPIVTPDEICSQEQFLNNSISIMCLSENIIITNFTLSNYKPMLSKYIADLHQSAYDDINNWHDYYTYVNEHFEFINITEGCLNIILKHCSFNDMYGEAIKYELLKINDFVKGNGGNPQAIDFKTLGKHYNPESGTRYIDLKKSVRGILDCNENNIFIDWHTWILDDFRLYFTLEKNNVCIVYYTKKIS